MSTPDRVIKTKTPISVIAGAVLIAVFAVGFVLVAIWYTGRQVVDARMSGTIVSKEFRPNPEPSREITLNREGGVSARTNDGEYILTVEVPFSDGTRKTFNVWLPDKAQFDALKVGDTFDVGAYVVPGE
ncbi:MAG: hypothetical protein SFU53_15885 [Terrimicrobiaceae bacterium]|nr:hypothetical protein [Terrimicrobiaceae bacterium]